MSAKGLTREVIVSEAVACMEHTGQPTVSLHELARRLGVKPPSLYNHIQNTRQLQREVFRYAIDKFVSHQEEAVAGKERDQAVRAFAQAYHAFAVENKGLYRLIMSIPSQEDDQAKELALPLLKTAVEVGGPLAAGVPCHPPRVHCPGGLGIFLLLRYHRCGGEPGHCHPVFPGRTPRRGGCWGEEQSRREKP